MQSRLPLILAHDYLIQMGGAERVVDCMARRYPDAPIYTSAVDRSKLFPSLRNSTVKSSWMQQLPGMPKHFKKYFAFYPVAFRSFGKLNADVAWISASTFAKCLRLKPGGVTVCYCHNPTRFLWQTDDYRDGEAKGLAARLLLRGLQSSLRSIDVNSATDLDLIVANSTNVRDRIQRCYGREATVVTPPVGVDRFRVGQPTGDFYLVVSRLLSYKRIDLAISACNQLGKKLVVVGEGPDRPRLENLAGPTVSFMGRLSDSEIQNLMETCQGLIFPGEEDFGITAVEAMACGRPVIAFAKGGSLETVKYGVTGVFFHTPEPEAVAAALITAEGISWDTSAIRRWAETFDENTFLRRMESVLNEAQLLSKWKRSREGKPAPTEQAAFAA